MLNINENCPCGLSKKYLECCGKFIEKKELPKTAEELMRSRYSAYTKAKIDYIKDTMIGPALKQFNYENALLWATESMWLKLEVVNHIVDKKDKNLAFVEFKAFYLANNIPQVLHEKSKFKKVHNKWLYHSGERP